MSGNRTFNIFHAAVADFDGVTVEDLVKVPEDCEIA